jgi:hypothetical protein
MSSRGLVVRLALVGGVFLAWLGYLGYLVATRPKTLEGDRYVPLVVSRPQVLASTLDVVAQIDEEPSANGPTKVTVKRVLYQKQGKGPAVEEGATLTVMNLGQSRRPRRGDDTGDPPPDWRRPGEDLLLLRPADPLLGGPRGSYEVTAVPPSPGGPWQDVVRIYEATPEALAQYHSVGKPAPEE